MWYTNPFFVIFCCIILIVLLFFIVLMYKSYHMLKVVNFVINEVKNNVPSDKSEFSLQRTFNADEFKGVRTICFFNSRPNVRNVKEDVTNWFVEAAADEKALNDYDVYFELSILNNSMTVNVTGVPKEGNE